MRASLQFVVGLFLIVIGGAAVAAREAPGPAPENAVPAADSIAPGTPGRLQGTVTDGSGVPLDDTLLSATGPSGTALAVCDADGRFEFRNLRPGRYLLRAHMHGFASAARHLVQVQSGRATTRAVMLRRTAAAGRQPRVLAAGFGLAAGQIEERGTAPAPAPVRVAPHDDSERAWWLRRARRSVLKDAAVAGVAAAGWTGGDPATVPWFDDHANAAPEGDLTDRLPVSGQLQLLTRTRLHASHGFQPSTVLPGQIAYVSLGEDDVDRTWGVRGAVRTGDARSWVLAGTFAADPSAVHTLDVGLSYSRQRVESRPGRGATDLLAPDNAADHPRRDAGRVRVDGRWTVAESMTLAYGATVAGYSYLDSAALVSPRATVTVTPLAGTRVRLAVSQSQLAPGAEEFLPLSDGVWLPPERTFAALRPGDPLRAERTRHVEVAVERDVGSAITVGVRRFAQAVDDQILTLFGAAPPGHGGTDHYYLANTPGATADGWAVMVAHALGDRLTGSVDYRVIDVAWLPGPPIGLTAGLPDGPATIHDVTTALETAIPETATRVLLLYRFNSAFGRQEDGLLRTGRGGRFAVRVRQTLPITIEGSRWEVLVDVRSLFREPVAGASVYDELLVVNPPKEVVGGLVVHF